MSGAREGRGDIRRVDLKEDHTEVLQASAVDVDEGLDRSDRRCCGDLCFQALEGDVPIPGGKWPRQSWSDLERAREVRGRRAQLLGFCA